MEGSVRVMGGFGSRFGGYTAHFHMELSNVFDKDSKSYLYKDN